MVFNFSLLELKRFKRDIQRQLDYMGNLKKFIDNPDINKNPMKYWNMINGFLTHKKFNLNLYIKQDSDAPENGSKIQEGPIVEFINELDSFKEDITNATTELITLLESTENISFLKGAAQKVTDETKNLKEHLNNFYIIYNNYLTSLQEYFDVNREHTEEEQKNFFSHLTSAQKELLTAKQDFDHFTYEFYTVLNQCHLEIKQAKTKHELTLPSTTAEVKAEENKQIERDNYYQALISPRKLSQQQEQDIEIGIRNLFFNLLKELDKSTSPDNTSLEKINRIYNDIYDRLGAYAYKKTLTEIQFENTLEKTTLVTPEEWRIIANLIDKNFSEMEDKIEKKMQEINKINNASESNIESHVKLSEHINFNLPSESGKKIENGSKSDPLIDSKSPEIPRADQSKQVEDKFKLDSKNTKLVESFLDECQKHLKRLIDQKGELEALQSKTQDYLQKNKQIKSKNTFSSLKYEIATQREDLLYNQIIQVKSKIEAIENITTNLNLLKKEDTHLNVVRSNIKEPLITLTGRRDTGGLVGISKVFWKLIDKLRNRFNLPKSTIGITSHAFSKNLSLFINKTLKNKNSKPSEEADLPSSPSPK